MICRVPDSKSVTNRTAGFMKNAYFTGYLKKRCAVLFKNLKLYRETGKPVMIHRIRVEIKKIRSVISFLQEICKKMKMEGRQLDSLFDDAGKLRDLHVLMALNKTFNKDSLFKDKFERKEHLLSVRFKRHVPEYVTSIKQLDENIRIKDCLHDSGKVNKYFRKQVKQIHDPFESASNLHQFRMKVKKLMYVYDALPSSYHIDSEVNRQYLDKMQHRLGRWHDLYTAVNFLRSEKKVRTDQLEKLEQSEQRLFKQIKKTYKGYSKEIFRS
jgi:CHAD domain-containing protein